MTASARTPATDTLHSLVQELADEFPLPMLRDLVIPYLEAAFELAVGMCIDEPEGMVRWYRAITEELRKDDPPTPGTAREFLVAYQEKLGSER